jgi:predicted dinucleotide-binding enzyme
MNITILGAGNMGSALATQLSRAGHAVRITSRDYRKAQALATAISGATASSAGEALGGKDVVILATGYDDAVHALRALGSLDGKVIVDITNPMTADFSALSIGHATSAAEEIAKAFPKAEVVKAFNTLFAQVLSQGANGHAVPAFYASDSKRAKETVKELIQSIGFEPVDAGPLKNARYLEPLAGLNIYFGYGAGKGTDIAPTWIAAH